MNKTRLIQNLIKNLNDAGLRYCHWKSNLSLSESLSGQTDIDLLVHREDASRFREVLSELAFKPATGKGGDSFPSVEHFFALDEESGVLAHVHAYYRVITGQSLTKNYRFPIEEMLLQHTRQEGPVQVPIKSAELIVFTLRILLKHTSLVELVLLARYWKQVKREINWLLENGSVEEAKDLIDCWLPALDPDLFSECVAALKSPAPLSRRIILGRRLRSNLKGYARHSELRNSLAGLQKFVAMSIRRFVRSQKELMPMSGGSVIAFVGPEATGKSTLLSETRGWLGEHFVVEQIHAGKPKSTLLSAAPNLLVPTLRRMLPNYKSSTIEAEYSSILPTEKPKKTFPLIFGIRAVLLAYDRRSLLTSAYSRAANGTIVLCDRYPLMSKGTPDSPQLLDLLIDPDQHPVRRFLARLEKRLYQEIPPPDLIISLTVPVEVAILRNKHRGKTEPEDFVRMRHAQSTNLEFGRTPVNKVDTNRPFEETILEVKKAVWKVL